MISLNDIWIAALAFSAEWKVFSRDKHFDQMQNVTWSRPSQCQDGKVSLRREIAMQAKLSAKAFCVVGFGIGGKEKLWSATLPARELFWVVGATPIRQTEISKMP